jgi:hypothetical protein
MAEKDVFERNKEYLAPGDHSYSTDLGPQEPMFQDWVKQNKVPFDPAVPVSDYDMRGFYKALQEGDPRAVQALNPNDNQMHFPDYWKTPYHESFSAESQWADPAKAPQWNDKDQLVLPNGKVVYDEKSSAILKREAKSKQQFDLLQKAKKKADK